MILEQITQEVSNRSFSKHNFNEINNSINIISESKKPTKKPKPKTQKNNFKKKEPSLTKKIAEEELQKKKTPNKKTKKTKKSKDLNETIEVVKDEL